MGVNGLLVSFLTRAAAVRHAQSAITRQSTAKDIGHAELYPFPNTVLALNMFAQNPSLLESGFKKSEVHVPTAFPIETVQQPTPGWNSNCDYLRLHFNRLRACNDNMDDDRSAAASNRGIVVQMRGREGREVYYTGCATS